MLHVHVFRRKYYYYYSIVIFSLSRNLTGDDDTIIIHRFRIQQQCLVCIYYNLCQRFCFSSRLPGTYIPQYVDAFRNGCASISTLLDRGVWCLYCFTEICVFFFSLKRTSTKSTNCPDHFLNLEDIFFLILDFSNWFFFCFRVSIKLIPCTIIITTSHLTQYILLWLIFIRYTRVAKSIQ